MPPPWRARPVVGPGGEKLGTVDDVYEDDETGRPEWAGVKSGLFGDHVSLVPLAQAEHSGETLTVPYTKAQIKAAPHHDPGQELSTDDEHQLFTHYGVPYHGTTITADTGAATTAPDVVGHDTSGPTTDDAMTRSEERLRVGTQQVESGRARLHKRVVTETVTQTVPVTHERAVVSTEPITEANRATAMDGPAISEEEHEIVLHEERPVVAKETVPVERVRLATDTVTEQQAVTEVVRKEQIEVDDPASTARGQQQK